MQELVTHFRWSLSCTGTWQSLLYLDSRLELRFLTFKMSTRFKGKCLLGDQEWVTLLSWKMPAFFYKLPCAFNYIIGLTMVNNSFLFFWEGWWKKVWSSDQPFRCSDLSLQEDRKEVDLGSEADCKSPKIIHRTTSLDNSINWSSFLVFIRAHQACWILFWQKWDPATD